MKFPFFVPSAQRATRFDVIYTRVLFCAAFCVSDGSSQRSYSLNSQSGVVSQFRGSTMSARTRAFAFLTLGRKFAV
jgi:hypothetical protein